MLKLYWTPATGGGTPADIDWQAKADSLRADSLNSVPLQNIIRKNTSVTPPSDALTKRLAAWLDHRSPSAPVTLLAHGYSYNPAVDSGSDPFQVVYAIPGPTAPAQLSFLPLVGECDEQGGSRRDVTIAFAWLSTGNLHDYGTACWDSSYKLAALDIAPLAAHAFATVIAALAQRKVPVRILAHSLGTRLVGQAIELLRAANLPTSIERIVLLGGAEYGVDAAQAYAGCSFDVVNVGSQHDMVLAIGQQACHPVRRNGSIEAEVIGRNGLGSNARWLDMQIDAPGMVQWAASGKAPTNAAYHINTLPEDNVHPTPNLCHWTYYTNKGNRLFVRDLMLQASMTVPKLRASGAPDRFDTPAYNHFAGQTIPNTPSTCAERRGDILIANSFTPATG